MYSDTIVIGSGLFGCIIARALEHAGQKVSLMDRPCNKAGRGSDPAACLMKPSWMGRLSKQQQKSSLDLLDTLYSVETVQFDVGLRNFGGTVPVFWVPPQRILNPWQMVRGSISKIEISDNCIGVFYVDDDGEPTVDFARNVVVAAGVWSNSLLMLCKGAPLVKAVEALAGQALLFPHGSIGQPFIRPWAPYKQLVAFNRGDGLWVGDGSSIKEKNWDIDRREASEKRCLEALPQEDQPHDRLFGLRPYVKDMHGDPAYLQQHMPGLWVATGGAKNGTIGAAWCATELVKRFS
jgi:glycine/D-amino acid oxidase-like deaminating enzyme